MHIFHSLSDHVVVWVPTWLCRPVILWPPTAHREFQLLPRKRILCILEDHRRRFPWQVDQLYLLYFGYIFYVKYEQYCRWYLERSGLIAAGPKPRLHSSPSWIEFSQAMIILAQLVLVYRYIYIYNGLWLSKLPQRVLNMHMCGW